MNSPDTAAPAQLPQYEVERWPVERLKVYGRNARKHSPQQIRQIKDSIQKFGQVWPILVRVDGTIIAGHGRLEAAKSMGLTEVRVIVANGWSDEQCRAFGILDNKVALNSEWDDNLLAAELSDLSGFGVDLGLLGFLPKELGSIFPDAGSKDEGTDEESVDEEVNAVPPAAPISKVGDLWLLGRHRILCGSSMKDDDVRRALGGDGLADVMFTDPPYGVSYQGSGKASSIAGDITQSAIPIAFKHAVEIATKDDARFYLCGGSSNVQMYYALFDAYLRSMPALIIWDKGQIVLRRNNYHSQYEIIFFGWKGTGGGPSHWYGTRKADNASDIWAVKRDKGADYLHPTQKPTALARRAIQNSCPPNGIVFEPFSGSGSTLIACEELGMNCRALEIDPTYVDVGVKRWQQVTGQKATLDGDGRTFDELAAERLPAAA